MSNTIELNLHARDNGASGVVNGVSGAVRSLIGQVMALAGLTAGAAGIGALIKQGVEFNKTMEDTKGGIAGVLLMTREYVDATGKVVTGQKAMSAAFAEASGIQEKLKKDALSTAASYTELVSAFQSSIGPASAAGVKNLDQLREITVMATQAMAALNIPTAQAAQELRGLFSGDMGPDNRLNQILRVSKDDLKALGGDAEKTAAFFKEKLGPAASAAAMQTGTLTVRLSNLGDILDQTMGEATAGLFKEVSGLVAEVTSGIQENKGVLVDLGETVSAAFSVVKETVSDVMGVVRQDLKSAGVTGREVLQALAVLVVGFVESVGAGMKWAAQLLTSPLETAWGAWKTLVFGIVSLFSELVLKMKDLPLVGDFFKGWSSNLDALVVSMTTVDEKFANFEKKAGQSFGGGAFEHARKLIDSFAGSVTNAGEKVDGLASKAKASADSVQAAAKAMAAKFEAETVPVFQGFWSDYLLKPLKIGWTAAEVHVTSSTQRILRTVSEWREGLRLQVERLLEFSPESAEAGVKAGWLTVLASIPKAAESAATAVQGVWQSMARTFDDAFYSVISGRLDSLGDVFRGFASDLQGVFSRLVTNVVERWISGQQTIAEGWAELNKSMQSSSGGLSWQGGAMAAGTGYGIGGMVGQGTQANQIGAAAGAVVGAIVLSAIPVVGTILGAIVGGLIGELFNKNTEKKFTGSLGAMSGATAWTKNPIYAPTKPGGPFGYDDGTYDPGEPIGWETVGTLQTPTTSFERAGQKALEAQTATFADIFRVGAKDQARELIDAYQKSLREMLSGAWVTIAAGSQEDIEKDAEFVIKNLLPRIGLSAAFGQSGYLPSGDRNAPGGIPGVNWGMPGMDESGNWTGATQLFDPEAPIPKMLAGLGFTNQAIEDLAKRISTDDPAKLLEYIQGIVGVVVGLRDLGAEMGKTFDELVAGWKDEAAAGPAAAFRKSAQDLAGQFDDLSLYSGDEQVTKAQEALAASNEFWESVKSYLQQLQALQEKLSAGLQGMREKMRVFLNPLSEGGQMAADQGIVDATWGRLLNATTPAEIETATNEAAAAIQRMFDVLAERVTRGTALLDRIGSLHGKLGSLGYDVYSEQKERTNPLEKWGTDLVDIQRRVQEAARLSGLEQISASEGAADAAETLYGNLKGLLSEISTTSASIAKSIGSQIWELGVGEMDTQGQAGAITQRIKELQDQLALATSPAEIAAITSEIQSLTSRYVGTFDKEDPNRAEAIKWAQEQLERARGLAQDALDAMRELAEAQAKELEGILEGAAGLISTNVSEAATAIGQLSHTLGELDKAVQKALKRLGQDALDSLGPLREAMDGAAEIFTGATATAGTALTAPESGLTAATERAAAATERSTARLNTFADALDRAVGRLNGLAPGSASSGPQQVQTVRQAAPSRTSSAEIVATIRRNSRQLTPRVA